MVKFIVAVNVKTVRNRLKQTKDKQDSSRICIAELEAELKEVKKKKQTRRSR